MPVSLSLADLMEYTDWERRNWHDWFRQGEVHDFLASPVLGGEFARERETA